MIRVTLYLLSFIIFSCQNKQGNLTEKVESDSSMTVTSENDLTVTEEELNKVNITLNVFDVGEPQQFTDTCAFYFECDCCSGQILFNSDSTFFQVEHCLQGDDVTFGTFRRFENKLMLSYPGKWISKYFNDAYTKGSSAPEYFISDTLLPAKVLTYELSKCSNKLRLTRTDKKEIAISTSTSSNYLMRSLKKDGFIDRLKNTKAIF
jgi:hypothetical protein